MNGGGGGGLDESEGEIGQEDSGSEEWQQALSVGGLGMSMGKGELASLIHHGAGAVLKNQVRLVVWRRFIDMRVLRTYFYRLVVDLISSSWPYFGPWSLVLCGG